jgi:hypothetical protein
MPHIPAPAANREAFPMDAPLCRTCGQRHWSRLCAVTKPVTGAVPVTPAVTEAKPTWTSVRAAVDEIETLRARVRACDTEVVMLKRELAEARGGKSKPLTSRERVARHRAKAKAR